MNPRILLRGLLLIGSLALAGYALETTHLLSTFNETWIDTQVRGRGISGQMLFIAVGALFAGVGMPRQVVCFLGGYGFGLSNGFLISLLASVIGCVGTFYYARLFGRRLITARFGRRIQKLDDFLRDNTFTMTVLARLLPIGSNLINNLVAGIAKVHALPFIAGSAVGYIPQTLVFALVDPAMKGRACTFAIPATRLLIRLLPIGNNRASTVMVKVLSCRKSSSF